MKSLGKRRTRRTRRTRRRRTRKVGGDYSRLDVVLFTLKTITLPKILVEMERILSPSAYEAFKSKTNEFIAVTDTLFNKARDPVQYGRVNEAYRQDYMIKFIEWRDVLDDPLFSADVPILQQALRDPNNPIFILKARITRYVDEVVNPDDYDPFIQQRMLEEDQRDRRHAFTRLTERRQAEERQRLRQD